MKGTFSAKVSDAVKLMQPIPMPLYIVDDSNLLDPTKATPSLNASQSALHFPVPTDDELIQHELRKRLAVDPHTIPYGEQTGRTKYAPMPKRAGSTIADKPATPQYPPFPFSIATTYLPAPTVDYTDTAYATWTTHSIENTVRLIIDLVRDERILTFLRLPQLRCQRWIRECKIGWSARMINCGSVY